MKLIIVGSHGTGKTSIIHMLEHSRRLYSSEPTVGVMCSPIIIDINNTYNEPIKVRVKIWDTAGLKQYKSLNKLYYNSCIGAILCFDITNFDSFLKLDNYLVELKEAGITNIILIGNKSDLNEQRRVTANQGKTYAQSNNLLFYIETSAITSKNILYAFKLLVQEIYDNDNYEFRKYYIYENVPKEIKTTRRCKCTIM